MSSLLDNTYDTFLEREEFVTAEEYLRRRERGEVSPGDARYVPRVPGGPDFGGFMIKLKKPRYRVTIGDSPIGDHGYGW